MRIISPVKFSKASIHHYQVLTRHRMIYHDNFFPIQTSITKQGLPTIQFFDCLQYAKMEEGEGLGAFIMWVMSIYIYSGRQSGRGALKWKSMLEALLAVSICALEFGTFVKQKICPSLFTMKNVWVKRAPLFKGSFPPSVDLGRQWPWM